MLQLSIMCSSLFTLTTLSYMLKLKSEFHLATVLLLGFVISSERIPMDPDKVRGIRADPPLPAFPGVCTFLYAFHFKLQMERFKVWAAVFSGGKNYLYKYMDPKMDRTPKAYFDMLSVRNNTKCVKHEQPHLCFWASVLGHSRRCQQCWLLQAHDQVDLQLEIWINTQRSDGQW